MSSPLSGVTGMPLARILEKTQNESQLNPKSAITAKRRQLQSNRRDRSKKSHTIALNETPENYPK